MESTLSLQTFQGPMTQSWPSTIWFRIRGSYLDWVSLSFLLGQDAAGWWPGRISVFVKD